MWPKFILCVIGTCLANWSWAQIDTIYLNNSSFEDIPMHSKGVRGWVDCGFPGESPPDVQPFRSSATWGQLISASEGDTYLGMVVRDNDTYERVGQRLSIPIQRGNCYTFSIDLCSSDHYLSASQKTGQMSNYVKPTVLRIWGSNEYCGTRELLAESPTIENRTWRQIDFEFKPQGTYSYIMLEAFYKTPTPIVYNGNVLVDRASPIIQTNCPGEEPLLAQVDEEDEKDEERQDETPVVRSQTRTTLPGARDNTPEKVENINREPEIITPPRTRILKNLERDKIARGQTIRIESLYFEADTARIDTTSYPVLEEIAYFLSQNEDVVVEIGGHTNGVPSESYCDRLSEARAKSVADYLYERGINEDQVKYKGYGKRNPIASNHTKWGRQRNQRVEIRILSFDG